jgi:transposase
MTSYHNFIGIDIGKFNFVVATNSLKETKEYENTSAGILDFLKDYSDLVTNSLCILETTGGYELPLLYTLCSEQIKVHRADTRKVKSFIRSYGNAAKTDALDARALAKYGYERHEQLVIFAPPSKRSLDLFSLVQRRCDLKQMLVAEKNRLKGPGSDAIKKSCSQMIETITLQIDSIAAQIKALIAGDPILTEKQRILKTIPGIGDIISFELLILLPELGALNRRQIASLAGLAPRANDSGKYQGYRKTGNGRRTIKPILFLAAMAARNSKSDLGLKEFYEKLLSRGKKKMVALVALMRKILVIANARLKSHLFA